MYRRRPVVEIDEGRWKSLANCRGADPDLFFPGRTDWEQIRAAKEVCRPCLVREQCLEYALANGEREGVWGGLNGRERRRLRRERKAS